MAITLRRLSPDDQQPPVKPMNRIRVLDSLKKHGMCLSGQKADLESKADDLKQIKHTIEEEIDQAHWFDFGRVDYTALVQPAHDFNQFLSAGAVVFPFEKTVFRMRMVTPDQERECVFLIVNNTEWVMLQCFGLIEPFVGLASLLQVTKEHSYSVKYIADPVHARQAEIMIGALWVILNTRNIEKITVEPAEKLNKARVKQGKKPLTTTVYVNVSQYIRAMEETRRMGHGTSPRMHLRRGHVRRMGERLIPVSACIVNADKGDLIKKDYKVQHD